MADAYLAIQRPAGHQSSEIVLAQKNIYLPPVGKYQYATIARHAVQYVLPGGRIQPGEQPAEAAVREFFEDTGVQIPVSSLQPLTAEPGLYWFFKVKVGPNELDLDAINSALANGQTASQKFNNLIWCGLDEAACKLGNKAAYQALPWVATQILRAMNAGFSQQLIGMRANEPHARFSRAVAQLVLDTYGPSAVAPEAPPAPAPGTIIATPPAS